MTTKSPEYKLRAGRWNLIACHGQGTLMAEKHLDHKHPDSDQRIKALEDQVKKLQQEVRDLQHKLETHDHPRTH